MKEENIDDKNYKEYWIHGFICGVVLALSIASAILVFSSIS